MRKMLVDITELWRLAGQDKCDGTCDAKGVKYECQECKASRAINEIGLIIREVFNQ